MTIFKKLSVILALGLLILIGLPFSQNDILAQGTNQLSSFTELPADGQTLTFKGNSKISDFGNIFVGDDDIENYSGVIDIQKDTLVSFSVSFVNPDSAIDLFVFKLPLGADPLDLSDFDVVDSSAVAGNPEFTGPSRFGIDDSIFPTGKYVVGLSIFDDPSVQPTDWALTVSVGGNKEVLVGDSGLPNAGVNAGNTPNPIQVNRVTPTHYPFKVTAVRLMTFRFQGQPNPAGRPIDLIVFTAPSGTRVPPANSIFNVTTVPISKLFQWVDYPLASPVTVNQDEELFVGYRFSSSGTGIFPVIDYNRSSQQRSYFSLDNGAKWFLLELSNGAPADFVNRAVGTFE